MCLSGSVTDLLIVPSLMVSMMTKGEEGEESSSSYQSHCSWWHKERRERNHLHHTRAYVYDESDDAYDGHINLGDHHYVAYYLGVTINMMRLMMTMIMTKMSTMVTITPLQFIYVWLWIWREWWCLMYSVRDCKDNIPVTRTVRTYLALST